MSQLKYVLAIVSLVFIVGCQGQKEDLQAYVANIKAKQKVDILPLPVMKAYRSFAYSASDLRDPFTKTVVEVPEQEEVQLVDDNGIRPDKYRLKEALESFELSELQLVGTLEQDNKWALVKTPDGVIHRVKKGNYLGRNQGKIQLISDSGLTLKEIVPEEGKGRYIERESTVSVIDVN